MTSSPAFQSRAERFTAHPAPDPLASESLKAPMSEAVAVWEEKETLTPVKLLLDEADKISKIPAVTVVYIVVVWLENAKMLCGPKNARLKAIYATARVIPASFNFAPIKLSEYAPSKFVKFSDFFAIEKIF